ncbi:hypothetical protein CDL12_00132 [Handroanthus impetiginosus]|uniref:Uncharacterized protein n=1 Tax=Handroanthus impetiginosus TaxID=429701 RepID=A0A2G9IBI2_9LAMI|nr:hypothetical protein CDL12_00132 [Handroanthus impetiginosus]
MNPRMKGCLVFLFLLFIFLSAGMMEGFGVGMNPLQKGRIGSNSRKLMGLDSMLDYDYAGPNPKHDPRGRRGGGGKNL